MDERSQESYRKELYDYLNAEGFELTPERHSKIKALVAPIKERETQLVNQAPKEHHVICSKCGGKRIYLGAKPHWKKRFNRDEFPPKKEQSRGVA